MSQEHVTFCRICEALCGMVATVEDGRLVSLRPDRENPHSKGFACTKGVAMTEVVNDPDRVTVPLRRVGGPGEFAPTTWDQALSDVATRLAVLRRTHGPDSIAISSGNPIAFSYSTVVWMKSFQAAIGTPWVYSSNSEDGASRVAACNILYGHAGLLIPDYRRTEVLMIIGANPWVSKGSFVLDPRIREHLSEIVQRGGRVLVVDPRKTETAKTFEHIAIRAGTDAWFLLSVLAVLVERGLYDEAFVRRWVTGFDQWRALLPRFSPAQTEPVTGVPQDTVIEIAEAIGRAKAAVVYGRTGTCTQKFGTLVNILQDFINIITGNLHRPGGWVWPWAPTAIGDLAEKQLTYDQAHTRVAHLPAVYGVFPSNALADDICTPGEGQVRAVVQIAANPVVTSPDGRRLAEALSQLDTYVSLDLYMNETNRYADYILPVTSMYEREDLLVFIVDKCVRPYLQATEAVADRVGQCRQEWEILDEIARRMGLGSADFSAIQRLLARLGLRMKPRTMVDLILRCGRAGDLFGLRRSGWSWRKLRERAPHGVVLHEEIPLGRPLEKMIRSPDRTINMTDRRIMSELDRLQADLHAELDTARFPLRLIGMRETKSHNSWMHNQERLMLPDRRLALRINPLDARRAGLSDGELARVSSAAGSIEVGVTLTDDLIPGTVALPHGWGHNGSWRRANASHGVSSNVLSSSRPEDLEKLAAMSVLNAIPVRVEPASEAPRASATVAGQDIRCRT